jgi:uncharacterized protein (DUF169 family)
MHYTQISEEISSQLSLDSPLIALAFVETPPTGVQTFVGEVPSACTFWREAASRVFYASADQHFNCAIGAMTMGFDMPPTVQEQLMGTVQKMCDCGYLSPEEPEKIPGIQKKKSGIVYGPLADFPVEADLVLMWLTPHQGMLYAEAVKTGRWTESAPTAVFGRPACAALPVAFGNSESALSLGCMGMRTFTAISQDRMLAVLPGENAADFAGTLKSTLAANETMREFYEGHKAKFGS